MLKEVQVVAFEGGSLRKLGVNADAREAVLALPLNRLLIKMVRVPSGEDAVAVATPVLQAMNPFPDEALTIGCETVRETEDGAIVIAAALPESAADDIGEALDAAKLNVVKIDALIFGQLRGLASNFNEADKRRLVLSVGREGIGLVVMDGDQPSAIRAFKVESDLRREVMLSLLEAEDFGGARKLAEILLVEVDKADADPQAPLDTQVPLSQGDPFAGLSAFAPVRRVTVGEDAALVGVAERAEEAGTLDALPESWREVLAETRFKRKLIRQVAIAGGVWALIMAILFGVPIVYGFMTDYQKGLSREHARQYREVREMKEKTDIVRKYSDHARGALEIMKALSDRLPEGIELSSWDYRREDGVSVAGEAEGESVVYDFKDAIAKMGLEEPEEGEEDEESEKGEAIFPEVNLSGLSASKSGQKFRLECLYKGEETE